MPLSLPRGGDVCGKLLRNTDAVNAGGHRSCIVGPSCLFTIRRVFDHRSSLSEPQVVSRPELARPPQKESGNRGHVTTELVLKKG